MRRNFQGGDEMREKVFWGKGKKYVKAYLNICEKFATGASGEWQR
jgi:hypothetical protein